MAPLILRWGRTGHCGLTLWRSMWVADRDKPLRDLWHDSWWHARVYRLWDGCPPPFIVVARGSLSRLVFRALSLSRRSLHLHHGNRFSQGGDYQDRKSV